MKKRTTLEIILIITNIITAAAALFLLWKAFEKKIIDKLIPQFELGMLDGPEGDTEACDCRAWEELTDEDLEEAEL